MKPLSLKRNGKKKQKGNDEQQVYSISRIVLRNHGLITRFVVRGQFFFMAYKPRCGISSMKGIVLALFP